MAPAGVEIEIWDGLRELPLFNPDLQQPGDPATVIAWKDAITSSDALLIACPEYVHGVPGSLKNALDWLVASTELDQKAVGVTASVNIEGRGRRALESLSHTLQVMGARVVGGMGIVQGEAALDALRALLADLVATASLPIDER